MLNTLKQKLVQSGTHGGPDLEHSWSHQVRFDTAQIHLLKPGSLIEERVPSSYPCQLDAADFATNQAQASQLRRTLHPHITIASTLWQYRQPRWYKHRHEPFTLVTAIWGVEKLKRSLVEPTSTALAQYLKDDYQHHFNDQGGHNWQIRQKAIAYCATREYLSEPARVEAYYQQLVNGEANPAHLAQVLADYGDYIDSAVNADAAHVPTLFEEVTIGAMPWVRFEWGYHGFRPDNLYYASPLDTEHLLLLDFSFNRLLPDTDQYWLERAREDATKVVTGTTVQRLALPQD